MSYSRGALPDRGGADTRAGPSAEAVAVVAQRLDGIAEEVEILRLRIGQLHAIDWRSPAAAAFRDSLSDRNLALVAVVRDITAAVAMLGSYASLLQSPPADGSHYGVQGLGG